jgi:hypothetical protein
MNIENWPSHEELDPDGLTEEERKIADAYMDELEEKEKNEIIELRSCEREVVEYERLIEDFRQNHSLQKLHAIDTLLPHEAPHSQLRERARKDLIPIVKLMNTLKAETDITDERWEHMKGRYLVLSRAVGIINKTQIRHR